MALISYAARGLDNRAETVLSFPSSTASSFGSGHYSEFLINITTGAGNVASVSLLHIV